MAATQPSSARSGSLAAVTSQIVRKYPLPDPGIRVRIKPSDAVEIQAAVFSSDPSGENGSNRSGPLPTGTVISFRGGAFFIAEASYLPNQSKDAKWLPGAYRVGAWWRCHERGLVDAIREAAFLSAERRPH